MPLFIIRFNLKIWLLINDIMKLIKNLVLSGGGLRGYSYLSLMKIMEEKPDLFDIKKIAGTSVGSVFAVFIAMGVKYKDLYERLLDKDTSDFQHIKLENILKFLEKFGIDDGESIMQFIAHFINIKFKNIHITLRDFFQLTGIDLYITGTCLNTRRPIYFNQSKYPDMSLMLAVRISISIPFYFIPIFYENRLYVDGGVMDNFPIQLFENELEHTLGIHLLDNRIMNENVKNFEDYAYGIYFANNNTRDSQKSIDYEPYCLNIPLNDIGVYSNSLSQSTRDEWESISYNLLNIYLNKRKMYPPPSYSEYLESKKKDECDTSVDNKQLIKIIKNIVKEFSGNIDNFLENIVTRKLNELKNKK